MGSLQKEDWKALATAVAVVFGIQKLAPTADPEWYDSLKKPKWSPRKWMFPAIWIPLKFLQSAAAVLAVKAVRGKALALPLGVFGVHLLLGNLWNAAFMGRHKLKESLYWMGAFWLSVAGSIAGFQTVDHTAALLMAPTLAWVTVAAALNYDLARKNSPPGTIPTASDVVEDVKVAARNAKTAARNAVKGTKAAADDAKAAAGSAAKDVKAVGDAAEDVQGEVARAAKDAKSAVDGAVKDIKATGNKLA